MAELSEPGIHINVDVVNDTQPDVRPKTYFSPNDQSSQDISDYTSPGTYIDSIPIRKSNRKPNKAGRGKTKRSKHGKAGADFLAPDEFLDINGPLLSSSRNDLVLHGDSGFTNGGNDKLADETGGFEHSLAHIDATQITDSDASSSFAPEKIISVKKRERILLVGLLCFISLAFALMLVMIYGEIEKYYERRAVVEKEQESCYSKECLHKAADMLESIDLSINPCDNFYQFACGGWITKQSKFKKQWSISDEIEFTASDRIKRILESKNDDKPRSPMWKAKEMYWRCHEEDSRERSLDFLQAEFRFIKSLLQDASNEALEDAQDIFDIIYLDWNIPLLFNAEFNPSRKSHKMIQVQLRPGGLNLDRLIYANGNGTAAIRLYREYMESVAKYFGASALAATKFSQETLSFEMALFHIQPINGTHEALSDYSLSILEFERMFPEIYIENIMESIVGISRINDVEISISQPEYFRRLNELVLKTNKRQFLGYMFWQLIYKYAMDLPGAISSHAAAFAEDLEGTAVSKPRWQHCVSVVTHWFSDVISKAYARKYLPPKHRKQLVPIVQEIQLALAKRIKSSEIMTNHSRYEYLKKLQEMKMMMGFPDFILKRKSADLDTLYDGFQIGANESFLELQLNGIRNDMDLLRSKLQNNSILTRWHMDTNKQGIYYDDSQNAININAVSLQPPHFIPSIPRSINYGAIGSLITRGMIEAFSNRDNQIVWLDPHRYDDFINYTKCMDTANTSQNKKQMDMTGRFSQHLLDIEALKTTLMAFEQYKSVHGMEKLLPPLEFSDAQTVFLAFAQNHCSFHPKDKDNDALSEESRVNFILKNVPEFSEDFGSRRTGNWLRA